MRPANQTPDAMNARCRFGTLILLLTCVFSAGVQAQEQPEAQTLPDPTYYKPLRFETVTQEDGLSQTTVATILQDHQGYLWFGVEGGLNRYDGYDFKVYTSVLFDTTSLSGGPFALFEDRTGVLWVGTTNGLNRFDRETETFTRFPTDLNDSTSVGGASMPSRKTRRVLSGWASGGEGCDGWTGRQESSRLSGMIQTTPRASATTGSETFMKTTAVGSG